MVTNEIDTVGELGEENIRAACESIIRSSDFSRARRMRHLFVFLVNQALAGNRAQTSEYSIGMEVFGRKPEDCIPEDPTVRVQMGRLRKRLISYYQKNPPHKGIQINIPPGQYMPVFRRVEPSSQHPGFHYLAIRPFQHITMDRSKGYAFAMGLHEELLHRMFFSFGKICPECRVPEDASETIHGPRPSHLIEGSIRIDSERMRTSIRLVDYTLHCITWAKHFDRSVRFDIREQEDLASAICAALEQVIPRFSGQG